MTILGSAALDARAQFERLNALLDATDRDHAKALTEEGRRLIRLARMVGVNIDRDTGLPVVR